MVTCDSCPTWTGVFVTGTQLPLGDSAVCSRWNRDAFGQLIKTVPFGLVLIDTNAFVGPIVGTKAKMLQKPLMRE